MFHLTPPRLDTVWCGDTTAPPVASAPATHGLWSLWDMLKSYARAYFIAASMLENASGALYVGELFHPEKKVVGATDDQHRDAIVALKFAAELCRVFPLGNLRK